MRILLPVMAELLPGSTVDLKESSTVFSVKRMYRKK